VIADIYNISTDRLIGRERTREVARPRQIAMYLMREETEASLPQIGETLQRDHTTVMYGHDKIADSLERDDKLRRQIMDIKRRLYN
jgi:chromosomal replication initiator protein